MTNFIRFLEILFLRLQNAKKSKAKAKSILRKIKKSKKSPTFKKNIKSKNLEKNNFPSVQFEIEWNIAVGDVQRRRSSLFERP